MIMKKNLFSGALIAMAICLVATGCRQAEERVIIPSPIESAVTEGKGYCITSRTSIYATGNDQKTVAEYLSSRCRLQNKSNRR